MSTRSQRDLEGRLLWPFLPRPGKLLWHFFATPRETPGQIKKRMYAIISAYNAAKPVNSEGNKIWVSFSKSPQERLRGSRAAWARGVLQELRIDLNFAALDVEYATASAWFGDSKISGVDIVQGKTGLFIEERSPDRPWFDMDSIAKEVGASRSEVESAIRATQR